jgi:hypothetical protein
MKYTCIEKSCKNIVSEKGNRCRSCKQKHLWKNKDYRKKNSQRGEKIVIIKVVNQNVRFVIEN